MEFVRITDNENLRAVRYDNCLDNVLDTILDQWNDVVWLRSFLGKYRRFGILLQHNRCKGGNL